MTPVLVVLADEITVKGMPVDVLVASDRKIAKRLLREPVRLDASWVDATFEQARRSTTWR